MTDEQKQALAKYIANVCAYYGDRIVDIVGFGSRSRGDNHEESDLDLAVVLEDGDWDYWTERRWMAGETFWPLVHGNICISSRPVRRSAWENPERHNNPRLVENMRRDARRVDEAA